MDFLNEIVLGVDVIVLGIFIRKYFKDERNLRNLENAPTLSINSQLEDYVVAQPNQKVPYALIRGNVTAIGAAMSSPNVADVKCVVHISKLHMHSMTRGSSGMWRESMKLMHTSALSIPFQLFQNDYGVEVLEPIKAAVLDLQMITEKYEPAKLTFCDHLFGFFKGGRPRGVLYTEEVLRCGTYLTGVGQLKFENGKLFLCSSDMGPLYLTTASKTHLLQRLVSTRNYSILSVVVTGSIALVLSTLLVRKLWGNYKHRKESKNLKELLESERRQRRINNRDSITLENQCVICQENPKEVFY